MFSRRKKSSVVPGSTVAQWHEYLDRLADGEVDVPQIEEPLPEAIGSEAVMRITNRAVEVVNGRLTLWSTTLERSLTTIRSETDLEFLMAKSRTQIAPIWDFAHVAPLPQSVLEHLQASVRSILEETQKSLENQYDKDPATRNTFGRAVRRASLVAVLRNEIAATRSDATGSMRPGKRRVIL